MEFEFNFKISEIYFSYVNIYIINKEKTALIFLLIERIIMIV